MKCEGCDICERADQLTIDDVMPPVPPAPDWLRPADQRHSDDNFNNNKKKDSL